MLATFPRLFDGHDWRLSEGEVLRHRVPSTLLEYPVVNNGLDGQRTYYFVAIETAVLYEYIH
jgi:hypothetical protein